MKRRALLLLFTCGLLFANIPGKITPTFEGTNTSTGLYCQRCGHAKKDHSQNKYMCMQFDGCSSFI